ncbi:unnamed protein product [Eruca vesicaria subsp. sativa]|uniref:Uncharacterized protein n=1 Tax=Eruca vesicaria subsp. sativa TaxID=29727 RepID=A0ABC8LR19_ERUVS|nr:unnamed protein product [Eruca vesicaria subsp. sativa]
MAIHTNHAFLTRRARRPHQEETSGEEGEIDEQAEAEAAASVEEIEEQISPGHPTGSSVKDYAVDNSGREGVRQSGSSRSRGRGAKRTIINTRSLL